MEQKKVKKRNGILNKVLKFIRFIFVILIVISAIINNYIGNDRDIYAKIGSMEPSSISVKSALLVKGYAIMPYVDCIKSGKTNIAYDMLATEYKKVVSYEEYLKKIENIDFDTFNMKQIKLKTDGTYVATVVYTENGEEKETEYLLYANDINPEVFAISPDKYIYSFQNLKFKMDSVEYIIENCDVYTDEIKLNMTLKNKSFFDIAQINNVGVGYGENLSKQQIVDIELKPGETRSIELEYETNYFVPNNIKIKRIMDKETLRKYTLYFDKAK